MNWQPVAKAPMEPDASVTFESNTYLVTDGHRVETCDFARGNGAGKPWADWSMYGGIPAGRISHWMPLPAAPGSAATVEKVTLPAEEWRVLEFWLNRCEANGHLENCSDLVEPWAALQAAIFAMTAKESP